MILYFIAYDPCIPGWKYASASGSCYAMFANDNVDWYTARAICRSKNFTDSGEKVIPDLTSINTEEELHQLDELFSENWEEPWLGGSYDLSMSHNLKLLFKVHLKFHWNFKFKILPKFYLLN